MSRQPSCPGQLSQGIRQAPANLNEARSARKPLDRLLSPNGLRGNPKLPLSNARHQARKGLADKQAACAVGLRARQLKRLSAEDNLTAIIEGKILQAMRLSSSGWEEADRLTGWIFRESRKPTK